MCMSSDLNGSIKMKQPTNQSSLSATSTSTAATPFGLDARVVIPTTLSTPLLACVPLEAMKSLGVLQQSKVLQAYADKLQSNSADQSSVGSAYRQRCLFLQAVQEVEKQVKMERPSSPAPVVSATATAAATPNVATTTTTTPTKTPTIPDFCLCGEAERLFSTFTSELQEAAYAYCHAAAVTELLTRDIKQPALFYNHHLFAWLSVSGVGTTLDTPDFCLPLASQAVYDASLSSSQQRAAKSWCCTEARKCRKVIRSPTSYYHKLFVKYLLHYADTADQQLFGLQLSLMSNEALSMAPPSSPLVGAASKDNTPAARATSPIATLSTAAGITTTTTTTPLYTPKKAQAAVHSATVCQLEAANVELRLQLDALEAKLRVEQEEHAATKQLLEASQQQRARIEADLAVEKQVNDHLQCEMDALRQQNRLDRHMSQASGFLSSSSPELVGLSNSRFDMFPTLLELPSTMASSVEAPLSTTSLSSILPVVAGTSNSGNMDDSESIESLLTLSPLELDRFMVPDLGGTKQQQQQQPNSMSIAFYHDSWNTTSTSPSKTTMEQQHNKTINDASSPRDVFSAPSVVAVTCPPPGLPRLFPLEADEMFEN